MVYRNLRGLHVVIIIMKTLNKENEKLCFYNIDCSQATIGANLIDKAEIGC